MKAILEVVDMVIDDTEEVTEIHSSCNCDTYSVTQEEYDLMLEKIANEKILAFDEEDQYIF